MNQTSDPDDDAPANATRQLAELNRQIEEAREILIGLRLELTKTQRRVNSNPTDRLLETNQMLVVGAMQARSDADVAQLALKDVSKAAELDALTELPNRAVLLDRLGHAIATARRHSARLALLFLDLDGFKQINDTLGHPVGDEVLKLVARCLTSSVREADTVSRHGGDEFLVLLPEISQPSDAGLVASKVIAAIGAPGRIGDHVFHLKASIGISIYPDSGDSAATLIERADAAMYRAKRDGLGSFVFDHEKPMSGQRREPAAPRSPQQPVNYYAQGLVDNERRYAQLREANERLVQTALASQELLAAAEQAQRR